VENNQNNDAIKRYKIEKRDLYMEMIESEKKEISQRVFYTGVSAIIVLSSNAIFKDTLLPSIDLAQKYSNATRVIILDILKALSYGVFIIAKYGCLWSTVKELTYSIISICKKTMFESKIEDINMDLAMLDLDDKYAFEEVKTRGKHR